MANTFELISAVTVGSGGASSIDFTSIPSTYTDLCVKLSLRDSGTGGTISDAILKFNNNASGYTKRMIYAVGSTVYSNAPADAALWSNSNTATASTFASLEIYIPNYAGSAYKSYSAETAPENNGTNYPPTMVAGLWSNTAAINQITISPTASPFLQYSTAYLYGVKNA